MVPPTTVKLVALFAGPPPVVVTCSGPVVAPVGTVAVICVAELTTYVVAAVVLNITDVVHPKFVPVMTTLAPTAPLVGRERRDRRHPAAAGDEVRRARGVGGRGLDGDRARRRTAGTVAVTVVSLTNTSTRGRRTVEQSRPSPR